MEEKITEEKAPEKKAGFFSRLKAGLQKTRDSLAQGLDLVVHGTNKVSPEMLDELEEVLLKGDVGFGAVQEILKRLRDDVANKRVRNQEEIRGRLETILAEILRANMTEWTVPAEGPQVILVIGINGSGKTTTIGKLAQRWRGEGKKVMIAAGDTFRAAAVEQLQAWADRVGAECIRQKSGADPSAVAYDAVQSALSRQMDIVLIDTAGRLQTNVNLMEELKKIKRVIAKVLPGAPHQTLLVLDASIGQNSISQAKLFHEALQIDGLVMTKLDGTSRGGVLFHISRELKLPVRFIGIGEKAEDLQAFDPMAFVKALFDE